MSLMRDPGRVSQPVDFSGIRFGRIHPTDIDWTLDLKGRAWMWGEVKFGETPVPTGQRLLMDNLSKVFQAAQVPALWVVSSHQTPEGPIDLASTVVREYRTETFGWTRPRESMTTLELVHGFLELWKMSTVIGFQDCSGGNTVPDIAQYCEMAGQSQFSVRRHGAASPLKLGNVQKDRRTMMVRLYPEAFERFIADPTCGVSSSVSVRGYRSTIRGLQAAYPEAGLGDFTEEMLVGFCGRKDLAPATKAGYRTRLEGIFSWAAWRGLIDADPAANLRRVVGGSFNRPVREHHWLSADDVTQVLDSVDTSTVWGRRAMVILRLGFTMGLRRAEIPGLRWEQLDLERQQARLTATKGGKLAATFITDQTTAWLRKWRDEAAEGLGREPDTEPVVPRLGARSDFATGWYLHAQWEHPVCDAVISKVVKRVSHECGIPFAPHDLRRSYANVLQESGYAIDEISAALRHSNLGTTERYLAKRQDAAYQALRQRGLNL